MLDNVPQITTKYREYVSVNSFIKDGTYLVTVPNSSCGKVMFSQASVILSTAGRCTPRTDTPRQTPPGRPPGQTTPPPPRQTTPSGRHPQEDPPLGRPHTPPPLPRWPLQRTASIPLECILVMNDIGYTVCLKI